MSDTKAVTAAPSAPAATAVFGRLGSVWVGALIGGVIAALVTSRGVLGDDDRLLAIGGDAGASFAVLRSFVNDAWSWPLLATDRLTTPTGEPVVIAFLDGVPLLALVAKLLSPLGLSDVAVMRGWYGASIILQGMAAGTIVRVADFRSRSVALAFIVVATASPVLMIRVVHPGLFGQFVLLWAWAAAIGSWRRPGAPGLEYLVGIIVVALLIHPYLFVMVTVLSVAVVTSTLAQRRVGLGRVLRLVVLASVSMATALIAFGYAPSGSQPAGGYGSFGMPVLSPFTPQWSGLFPGRDSFLTNSSGSIEGLNYYGFGSLLLVGIAGTVGRDRLAAWAQREQVLVVFLGGLTAFAVSPVIYIASSRPLRPFGTDETSALSGRSALLIGLVVAAAVGLAVRSQTGHRRNGSRGRFTPALVTAALLGLAGLVAVAVDRTAVTTAIGQFRSSGRMFWIVGYGVLCGSAILIDRHRPRLSNPTAAAKRWLPALMAVVLIGHLVDVRNFLLDSSDRLVSGPERVAWIGLLEETIAAHDTVHLASSAQCTANIDELHMFQDVIIASSLAGRPVDNSYAGWVAVGDCSTPAAFDRTPSRVTFAVGHAAQELRTAGGSNCVGSGPFAVCSSRWNRLPANIPERFAGG